MAKPKNLRKKAVADKQVQYALARRVILHFFVFICAGAFFGIINQFLTNPFGGVRNNVETFFRHSAPMFVALVCLMPIFVRDTLTLSNRIAGPIHNLRNTIKNIAEGSPDTRPLRFRDGDFWTDLPDQFNAMTKRLKEDGRSSAVLESIQPSSEKELTEA